MTGTVKPKAAPAGLNRPSTRRIIKAMTVAHLWLYRRSGGRLGRRWHVGSALRKGVDICLLTTTGRKSGERRTVPLLHMADGDRVIVVASQGGMATNPAWYLNVVADPDVEVEYRGTRRAMRARTAHGGERAQLWSRLVEMYSDFDNYQAWTEREIPVVICEPV